MEVISQSSKDLEAQIDVDKTAQYHQAMVITAAELKTDLDDYLERAENGETIVVTRSGRPSIEICLNRLGLQNETELVSVKDSENQNAERRIGSVRPPLHSYRRSSFQPLRIAAPPLSEVISEDREDRF